MKSNFQFSIFKADAFGRLPDQGRRGFQKERGFALLIAVIFMSVMLSFGLALGALGYKQQVLASAAISSTYAFYATDTALECTLYADQQLDIFSPFPSGTPASAPVITCDGTSASFLPAFPTGIVSYTTDQWVIKERFSLDSDKRCADVTIYKYSAPLSNGATTYIFSQGYDVPCSVVSSPGTVRFVSRGESAHY